MKKLNTILLLSLSIALVSFSPRAKKISGQQKYVFVTASEFDKQLEETEEGNSFGVFVTSNIVSISCDNLSKPGVEIQFTNYYEGEHANGNRKLYGYGFTHAWIYETYDEAYAARRDMVAETMSNNKRRIEGFYITCN